MKVLFVCSANICRSALAEVVLRAELEKLGVEGVEVTSAGIYDFSSRNRDSMMREIAREAGYELCGISRHITQADIDSSDLIIVMDWSHFVKVQKELAYAKWDRLHRFLEICFGEEADVPDPTFDTEEKYRSVFQQIVEGCKLLAGRFVSC